MENQQCSDLTQIRHRRVWHSYCVTIANMVEIACQRTSKDVDNFIGWLNKTEKEQVLKIIEQRKLWRSKANL